MDRFLAVTPLDEVYMENSLEAVNFALVNELEVKYYRIVLDEHNNPSLEEVTENVRSR